MKSYANKIKTLRKDIGLSQDEFAEKIGVSRQTIYKWEGDIIQPTPKNLKIICETFAVSAEYFFEVNTKKQVERDKKSVFYEDDKMVKTLGFIIAITAELFVLGWSVFSLVIRIFEAKRGSTIFNEDAMLNDYLYFGLIILSTFALGAITACAFIKFLLKQKTVKN